MHEAFEVVHSYLMESLFDPIEKQLVKDIEGLGFSNRAGLITFRYKRKQYNIAYSPSNFLVIPELKEHLHPQMELLVIEEKEVNREKLQISAYICRMLNKADSFIDVYNLLPESVHRYLNGIINKCGRAITISPEEITAIYASEKEAIHFLNNRILTNLLLGDK